MRWKKLCIILLVVGVVLVSLDFIPVRFAKDVDTIYNDVDIITEPSKDIDILASRITKTLHPEYTWEAFFRQDSFTNVLAIFNIKGNSPYQKLSRREFYNKKGKEESSLFRFMLSGKFTLDEDIKDYDAGEFDISTWKIVYPIERKSFRRYYVPESYLTIYDFDWLEVIKSWFVSDK
jgi:hypothetical protein